MSFDGWAIRPSRYQRFYLPSLATDPQLWHKYFVSAVIEKVLLALCMALLVGNILSNPLSLDRAQRIFLGAALAFFACFLAYTAFRTKEKEEKAKSERVPYFIFDIREPSSSPLSLSRFFISTERLPIFFSRLSDWP